MDTHGAHVDSEHREESDFASRKRHLCLDAHRSVANLHQREVEHLGRNCLFLHLVSLVVEEQHVNPCTRREAQHGIHLVFEASLHARLECFALRVLVVLHHKLGSALVTHVKKRDDGGEIVQIIICHLLYIVVQERQGDAEENRAPAFHLFERHLLVALRIFVVFLDTSVGDSKLRRFAHEGIFDFQNIRHFCLNAARAVESDFIEEPVAFCRQHGADVVGTRYLEQLQRYSRTILSFSHRLYALQLAVAIESDGESLDYIEAEHAAARTCYDGIACHRSLGIVIIHIFYTYYRVYGYSCSYHGVHLCIVVE